MAKFLLALQTLQTELEGGSALPVRRRRRRLATDRVAGFATSFAMPFICIGPVCIPWSALLPVIVYLGRPVWNRLPPPVQKQLTEYANAFTDWIQANVWDAIGWKAKAEKPKLAAAIWRRGEYEAGICRAVA